MLTYDEHSGIVYPGVLHFTSVVWMNYTFLNWVRCAFPTAYSSDIDYYPVVGLWYNSVQTMSSGHYARRADNSAAAYVLVVHS